MTGLEGGDVPRGQAAQFAKSISRFLFFINRHQIDWLEIANANQIAK
jgi:hypothetical protein